MRAQLFPQKRTPFGVLFGRLINRILSFELCLSFYSFRLLNSIFLFFTRFSPSRKTIAQTAAPITALNIHISVSDISPNDTSIERCNENIETQVSDKDMFRKVTSLAEELFRALIKFIIASVIFVKEYVAIAIITISCITIPLSRITESITVPTSGRDSSISIMPVNFVINLFCFFV